MVRSLSLDAVLRFHVELACHLRAVICPKVIIERLVVAGDATADACGVRREDGGYLRHVLPDVERSEAGHPLVCLVNDLFLRAEIIVEEAFHDEGCGIAEHAGFVVVAVGMEAVDTEVLPSLAVDFVLLLEVGTEIDKDDARFAGNVPPADTDMQAAFGSHLHPRAPQRLVFQKEGILLSLPHIGTDEQNLVRELLLKCLGTRREHRIDATHLVAHFPTALENKVWYQSFFSH